MLGCYDQPMAMISMDLRQRILKAYDRGDVTREQVASRFDVSLGMVKKLLQQRRATGDIAPRYNRCGRKPVIIDSHRRQMRALLAKQPDLTLEEIRIELGLCCTIQAIHYVLADMGLTYKKRLSGQRSNPARMLPAPAVTGVRSKEALNHRDSSSLMSRRPRRT
jgi:transposase